MNGYDISAAGALLSGAPSRGSLFLLLCNCQSYHLTLGDDKNRDGRPLDKDGNPIDVSDEVALQIVGIRYTMRFTAFQKYESTTIATDISDETVADILEHAADLVGVNIQESTIRVYNESLYFAPIIGYTGKVTSERLEELKAPSRSAQQAGRFVYAVLCTWLRFGCGEYDSGICARGMAGRLPAGGFGQSAGAAVLVDDPWRDVEP